MGVTRRKLLQLQNLYGKKLKSAIANVINLMPDSFSDIEFLTEFKECYQYLWEDLDREHRYYIHKNREFKGNKPLSFPEPSAFVLGKAYHAVKKAREHGHQVLQEDVREQLRSDLVNKCRNILQQRKERVRQKTNLLQNVVPNYASNMIASYFHNRKTNPADVNIRYYILNEIAKFNNDRFIGFFIKVMNSERNDACREFAFRTLQKWDKTIHLSKKRKGKKAPGEHIQPAVPSCPDELMETFYKLQMESNKSYNVFLSHRYEEGKHDVINIKDIINRKGFSVYVDWMIDRDGLPRDKENENTLNVIKQRIMQSDCLLYIHTKDCEKSWYIPQELDYAELQHKPIAVLNIDGSQETERTQDKPHSEIRNNEIIVTVNGKEINIDKWINIKN